MVFGIVVVAMMFDGQNVQFLKPSIYQEVINWGATLAGGFVFLLVRLLLVPGVNRGRHFVGMAALTGMALLARATTGLELYVALGLLLCVELIAALRAGRGVLRFIVAPTTIVAIVLLVLCAAAVGGVNWERWGNPFTTADYHLYAKAHTDYVDRLGRLDRYGVFNVTRLPFGLQYYFLPLWILPGANGGLVWTRSCCVCWTARICRRARFCSAIR